MLKDAMTTGADQADEGTDRRQDGRTTAKTHELKSDAGTPERASPTHTETRICLPQQHTYMHQLLARLNSAISARLPSLWALPILSGPW
jgi:hypothetical protein